MGGVIIFTHTLLVGARMPPHREGSTHLDLQHSHLPSVE